MKPVRSEEFVDPKEGGRSRGLNDGIGIHDFEVG